MKATMQFLNRIPKWMPISALAAMTLAGNVQATVWTFTNQTSTAWTIPTNWSPNSVAGFGTIPNLGATNYPGRINVSLASANRSNCRVIYDSPLTTGVGTFDLNSPEFGRAISVANGSSTTGALEVVSGTLVAFQAVTADAVIMCAAGNSAGTSKGYLTLNGGNLTIIATNYGVISFPFRGSANSLGMLTVTNGSTLKSDRIRFGGTGASVDIAAGLPGVLNLYSGGTLHIRNIGNYSNPANLRATNNFDGGTIRVLAAESSGEGRNPLIGINIVNNLFAKGLTVDTAGFDARIVSPLLNKTGGLDGGLVKNGSGTLNLRGVGSTYTGPSVVNLGTLGVQVPMVSTDFRIQTGATLNFITDNAAPWAVPSLGLTNVNVGFDYGNFAGYTGAVIAVNNLDLQGANKINLVGTSFPVTDLTLLTYTSKTGSGSLTLGTLPTGATGTIEDTGSALILHLTSASLQALTWTASFNNNWQTNGAANWNFGTATYLEYPSGVGDLVTFDDSSFGTVNLASVLRPTSVTVSANGNAYVFSGPGRLSGPTDLDKFGTASLQLSTSNDFTGIVEVGGGTLLVDHPQALGTTNGSTLVTSGGTVQVGSPGGIGLTVADERISLIGNGFGGALGALRGGATASGSNVWAGLVILADNARIGTEDNGNLTVAGSITDQGSNLGVTLRPGAGGVLVLSGANNSWAGATLVFGGGSGKVVLGRDNVLPLGSPLQVGEGVVDLNGHLQTVAGLGLNGGVAGNANILNNGAAPATLTVNSLGNNTFPGNLQDGTGQLALIKQGTNSLTLTGFNTYTGPTVVNGGSLAVTLPLASSALALAEATTLTVGVAGSTWSPSTLAATNTMLNLNYGAVFGAPPAVFSVGTLAVSGSNVINVTGANLPAVQIPLIAYTSKTGGGSFHLGTVPVGMQATILDTGSAIVLDVNVSPQTLTWYGFNTGTWNTNGTLDWNFGVNAYQEYGPATNRIGDFVVFDDTAAVFAVTPSNDVRPYSITVNNPANAYTFSGPAKISGPTTLTKLGAGALMLGTSNDFTGGTAVRGGAVTFATGALGTTGAVMVATGGTLAWADSNSQDLSARLRVDGASGTPVTLDLGTNDVVFTSGLNQNSTGGPISNALTRVGSGTLTLASGATALGQVVRLNAGAVKVDAGASLSVEGNGVLANAALVVDRSTLLIAGGTVSVGDRFGVATAGGSTGVVTLASGSLTVDTGSLEGTRGLRLAGAGGTGVPNNDNVASFNLDGGTLTTARIFQGNGLNNTSLFHFNGGTLKPSANALADAFLTGLTHAYVKSGGAFLDTAGADPIIGQPLENDGVAITDGGLTKLGAGKLILAGTNTYTGPTLVNGGMLWVNGATGTNTVTVASSATLGGTGTISGPVTVSLGATLAPGATGALGETLTINHSLHLAGTTVLQIGAAPASDSVAGVTDITYGGALIVTNATGATLAPGDVFTLFAASGVKIGNFGSVQVRPASLGLSGTFNPATGQLTLASGAPPTLSYTSTGSGLQFSWTGTFKLQAQTNSLSVGLSNNWADYPGGATSGVTVPLDATVGSVFFRLVSP